MSDFRPAGGAILASTAFATPAIALGLTAAAGTTAKAIRSDSTIAAFDATAPTTSAIGDVAAVGTINFAARRDHLHGREAFTVTTPGSVAAAGALGVATTLQRSDHVHPHGSGYLPDAHHNRSHDHSNASDGTTLQPVAINAPSTAAVLYGSIFNFERTATGAALAEGTMHVKITRTGAGGTTGDAVTAVMGDVDVTGSVRVSHVAGVLGYISPSVTTDGGTAALWTGVEAHVHATTRGTVPLPLTYYGVLGDVSLERATDMSNTYFTGVDARVDIAAGASATGAVAAGLVARVMGTGWFLAQNAILGQGTVAGENYATSFRGYSSLTGNTGEAQYNISVLDAGAALGGYVLHDVSDLKLKSGLKYKLADAAGNASFQVTDSANAIVFAATSIGGWSGAKVIDITQATAPGAPGAGVKRLYVDSADSKMKVISSSSVITLLEEQVASAILTPESWTGAANNTTATNFATNSSYFVYVGKAQTALTTADLVVDVITAAATITWAEVAIFKGTVNANGASGTLTRLGSTDVSTTFNSTGVKKTTIALSGVQPGDDLWVGLGSQATTPYQVLGGLAHVMLDGGFQVRAATRLSTATAAAGALVANTIINPFCTLKV